MTKYRNLDRDAQLDAELEAEEAEYRKKFGENPEPETPNDPEPATQEEKTWQKRHSDLRSYSQRQLNERDAKIRELEQQLKDKTADPRLPVNRAEAEDWVKTYPDLARVISTLIDDRAEQKVSSVSDEVRSVKMELEAERTAMARERAMTQILKAHPDFIDLIQKQEFKDWVEDQPRRRGTFGEFIYNSLYQNETDAQSAIEAVNLYKSENGSKKPDRAPREAALSVRTPASENPPSRQGKQVWLESEIEKMKPWDFDKYENEIEEARREGRITYDLSGAAR